MTRATKIITSLVLLIAIAATTANANAVISSIGLIGQIKDRPHFLFGIVGNKKTASIFGN